MRDKEVSLLDVVVKILLGWRVVLMWMLVGAILMGGLSCVQSYQTQKTQQATQEQILQADEEYFLKRLSETQLYDVYAVLEYESFSEEYELYFQESVKMHIDPFNEPRAELTYRVNAEDLETAYQIRQIYKTVISAGLSNWLVEGGQEEVSAAAMGELIELWTEAEGDMLAKDSFSIVVYHTSEEQCLDLAERVAEYIQEQYSQLKKKLGNHEIQLVSQDFTFVMDRPLLSLQQGTIGDIIKWRANSAKLKEDFEEMQWQYYNYIKGNNEQHALGNSQLQEGKQAVESEKQESENITMIHPSINLKYVILDMIAFAVLYAFYIFLKCVFNEKIQMTDDINAMYGVNQLGLIPAANKRKKIMAFVDDWILRLYEKNKRHFSAKKATELAAAAVKIAAQKTDLMEVCCVGCNLQSDTLEIVGIIEETLKREKISMEVVCDILYDQESMERVMSAKGVFLLEKAGETLYDEIDRELKFLRSQDIKVLGVIVME